MALRDRVSLGRNDRHQSGEEMKMVLARGLKGGVRTQEERRPGQGS